MAENNNNANGKHIPLTDDELGEVSGGMLAGRPPMAKDSLHRDDTLERRRPRARRSTLPTGTEETDTQDTDADDGLKAFRVV